ncbi:hypothetical protein RN001_003691 [Aquatica leii]|uniref:THAP-type domain-containing protein n=1 Tax=Aquatica leii TaxID=1421715 RepID=A0AAN7QBW3_9COLE|nr:hypothetical protein RN001_003691 [Aquatica leii]
MGKQLVDRRDAWIIRLRIGKPVTKFMKVCSLHFKAEDYFNKGQKSGSRGRELKKIAVPSQNLPALTTGSSTSKAQSLQSNRAERYWNRQLMEAYPDGPCDQSEIDENNTEAEILAAQGLVNLLNSKQDVTEIDINSATNSLVEVRDAEIQVPYAAAEEECDEVYGMPGCNTRNYASYGGCSRPCAPSNTYINTMLIRMPLHPSL